MPSIAVQSAKTSVTAATNKGRLTVTSNAYIFPGANAWLALNDGSASVRVKILACIGTDTVLVRKWPLKKDPEAGISYTLENYGPPSYGLSDVSAYNGSAYLAMEAQSVPVDPTYAKRVVP